MVTCSLELGVGDAVSLSVVEVYGGRARARQLRRAARVLLDTGVQHACGIKRCWSAWALLYQLMLVLGQ